MANIDVSRSFERHKKHEMNAFATYFRTSELTSTAISAGKTYIDLCRLPKNCMLTGLRLNWRIQSSVALPDTMTALGTRALDTSVFSSVYSVGSSRINIFSPGTQGVHVTLNTFVDDKENIFCFEIDADNALTDIDFSTGLMVITLEYIELDKTNGELLNFV